MKKTLLSLIFIVTALSLNACATGANPLAMTAMQGDVPEFKSQDELKTAIQ